MHEFKLIKKYFSKLAKKNKSSLELNDDVFFDRSKKLVVSVDTYVEGIHFLNFKKPNLVIKKILRSSISDLICKGVEPKYYFISGSGNKKSFSKINLSKISISIWAFFGVIYHFMVYNSMNCLIGGKQIKVSNQCFFN